MDNSSKNGQDIGVSRDENDNILVPAVEPTDCVFVCSDGVEVPAWRFPLTNQSTIFRELFGGETEEAKTVRVKVSDANSAVMQGLIRFACFGEVDSLTELASELLVTANKYGIEDLKDICAHHLLSTLSEENVCPRLMIAGRHNVNSLKNAAFQFIAQSSCPVNKLNAALKLYTEYPDIAFELCNLFLKKKYA